MCVFHIWELVHLCRWKPSKGRKKFQIWILTLTIRDRLFQRIMIILFTFYLFTVVLSAGNTIRWYCYCENFSYMIDCIISTFTQSPCKSATLLTPVRQDKTLAWLVVPPPPHKEFLPQFVPTQNWRICPFMKTTGNSSISFTIYSISLCAFVLISTSDMLFRYSKKFLLSFRTTKYPFISYLKKRLKKQGWNTWDEEQETLG